MQWTDIYGFLPRLYVEPARTGHISAHDPEPDSESEPKCALLSGTDMRPILHEMYRFFLNTQLFTGFILSGTGLSMKMVKDAVGSVSAKNAAGSGTRVKSTSNELLDNSLECEYHVEDLDRAQNPTTRVRQFLSNAFRPRYRQEESVAIKPGSPMPTSRSSMVPNGPSFKPSRPVSPDLFQTRSLDHSLKPLPAENTSHNSYSQSLSVSASIVGGGRMKCGLSVLPSPPHCPAITPRLHVPQRAKSDQLSAVASLSPPSPVVSSALLRSSLGRWLSGDPSRSCTILLDRGLGLRWPLRNARLKCEWERLVGLGIRRLHNVVRGEGEKPDVKDSEERVPVVKAYGGVHE
ncbi:hypothetical protein BU17DRAFT_85295 [Hysterangium stoloniferum]|nr:hypothetical protein BU17DRAFT_85295 [Hysterangium stoloniferum]